MITIKTLVVLTFAGGLLFSAPEAHAQPRAAARQPAAKENKMAFDIPKSMKAEHDELHSDLAQLTKAGGRTGAAAKSVAEVLEPHFAK